MVKLNDGPYGWVSANFMPPRVAVYGFVGGDDYVIVVDPDAPPAPYGVLPFGPATPHPDFLPASVWVVVNGSSSLAPLLGECTSSSSLTLVPITDFPVGSSSSSSPAP